MFTPTTRSSIARYGLSLIAVGVVVILRSVMLPTWSLEHPYVLFYPAIILAGWFGGFGPGVFATLLAAFALAYLWFPPLYSFRIGSQQDAAALMLFVAINFFISLLNEALLRAKQRTAEHAAALDRETGARHAAVAETSRLTSELQQLAERLRTLSEADLAGRLQFTRGGTIVECNESLGRMIGARSRGEVLGSDPRTLFAEPADFEALVRSLVGGVVVTNARYRWRRRDGHPITVLLNARETKERVDVSVVDVSATG